MKRTFSSLCSLLVVFGMSIWQVGCGSNTPDDIIIIGDGNLPTFVFTTLTDGSGDPAMVGIGSTLEITWSLTGELDDPIVKLYLQDEDDNRVEITPDGGIDGDLGSWDFTPTEGLVTTGEEYSLVAELYSYGRIFDITTADQLIRISDGGIVILAPVTDLTLARGLPVDVTWYLTNNICVDLKDKPKTVRIYVDSDSVFDEDTAIEVTDDTEIIQACDGSYTIQTGEIERLQLDTAYYIFARLYIDGIEADRAVSAGTFTATTSLRVTSPENDVIDNLQSVSVSWEVLGRSAAGLKVEILAMTPQEIADDIIVERVISPVFSADQGTGLADASKLPYGSYNLVVRLFEYDSSNAKVNLDTAAAPGMVIISNGYAGSFDLADMAAVEDTNYSPVDGLVFEGYNIDEMLGFEVAGVGDLNGDGFTDFLLFSRFDQQYTTGNSGGAYLIYGQETYSQPVINVNSVASSSSDDRVVEGTIMLLPMDNLASMEPGTGKIFGDYTAIGMPDISGDGLGDLFIGCPDAAPLTIIFDNQTSADVNFECQYGLVRTIAAGARGYEKSHVQPYLEFHTLPFGDGTIDYHLDLGNEDVDWQYAPGDTITIVFSEYPDNKTYTDRYVSHDGYKRGATYTITSQRLVADEYKNSVYELNKIGSPVEDGVADVPSATIPGGSWIFSYTGRAERCEMTTWIDEECRFGADISVMGDINGDGYPNQLITIPNATVYDLNGDELDSRTNAGLVRVLDGKVRRTSILSGIGQISRLWPVFDSFNGEARNSDGSDWMLDIIGSQTNSELTAAAGLGKFVQIPDPDADASADDIPMVTQYVNGSFNPDDTRPDVVLGAPGEISADGFADAGCIYILLAREIFGRHSSVIDLADLNHSVGIGFDPSLEVPIIGLKVQGTMAGERLGEIVKPAGDFNGDGLADVIFSTPNADADGKSQAGRVFIMFGQDQLGDFTLEDVDSHLGTQLPALIFEGANEFDGFGSRIVAVYDVNDDGLDDILVAAPDADAPGKIDCGKIYLIYGKKNIIKTDASLPDGINTYVDYDNDGVADDFWSAQDIGVTLPGASFIGEAAGNHLQAMAGAGDVNGDGIGDFLIGAPNTNVSNVQQNAGKAYLIFGRKYVLPN